MVSEKFFNSESPVTFTKSLAKNVSLEEFAGIPIGIPLPTTSFPNTSLVRPNVGTAILADSYAFVAGINVRNYPVYGRIPGGQAVPPGSYSDTLIVTLTY